MITFNENDNSYTVNGKTITQSEAYNLFAMMEYNDAKANVKRTFKEIYDLSDELLPSDLVEDITREYMRRMHAIDSIEYAMDMSMHVFKDKISQLIRDVAEQLIITQLDTPEKQRCRHCAYLVEGDNGEWICDDHGKDIHDVTNDDCTMFQHERERCCRCDYLEDKNGELICGNHKKSIYDITDDDCVQYEGDETDV